jgi:hypothetical protein
VAAETREEDPEIDRRKELDQEKEITADLLKEEDLQSQEVDQNPPEVKV